MADDLRGRGLDVVEVREPGGTPIGEQIRALLLDAHRREMAARAEMLLFAASRAQLVADVIAPALQAGRCVVCDRYVDASLAYQGVGRGLGIDVVRSVNQVATGGLVPDLTLLLDIDVEIGLERARAETGRGALAHAGGPSPRPGAPGTGLGDRMEQELLAFHRRVREGFLSLAKNEPQRITVIDARGSVTAVQGAIRQVVAQLLRGREGPGGGEGSR